MIEVRFPIFKYFLEGYFNESADYEELDQLIEEFYDREQQYYQTQLKSEVKYIMSAILKNDKLYCELYNFIRRYGGRRLELNDIVFLLSKINEGNTYEKNMKNGKKFAKNTLIKS